MLQVTLAHHVEKSETAFLVNKLFMKKKKNYKALMGNGV